MLAHILSEGLLPAVEDGSALRVFPLADRRRVCDLLLADLGDDHHRLAAATATPPQCDFILEVLSHALTLPFYSSSAEPQASGNGGGGGGGGGGGSASSNETAAKALMIYNKFCCHGESLPGFAVNDAVATQRLFRRCMQNLSLVFEVDETIRNHEPTFGPASARTAATPALKEVHNRGEKKMPESHESLCQRALRTYEELLQRVQAGDCDLEGDSWNTLLCVLLGICDRLVSPPVKESGLGDALALQVVHLCLGAHYVCLQHRGTDFEAWTLLSKYNQRWAHRNCVVATWHSAVASLADLLRGDLRNQQLDRLRRAERSFNEEARQVRGVVPIVRESDGGKKLQTRLRSRGSADLQTALYCWPLRAPDPIESTNSMVRIQFSQPAIHFAFIQTVHLLGNPNRIADPLRCFPSPSVHHRAMLGISHLCAILLGDADQTGQRPNFARSAPLTNGHAAFLDTHPNTLLRLVGGWLFDAALNPNPMFAKGRAAAILTLGELFCKPRRQGGRGDAVPTLGDLRWLRRLDVQRKREHEDRQRQCLIASAKPSPAHTARYILTLKAALSVQQGNPETFIAVLRASHGILGLGIPGSRCLLKPINEALRKILSSHTSSEVPLSSFFNTQQEDNKEEGGAFASFFSTRNNHRDAADNNEADNSRTHWGEPSIVESATGDGVSAHYCSIFPNLDATAPASALEDTEGQRLWCTKLLFTECCLPTHFGDSLETFLDLKQSMGEKVDSLLANDTKNRARKERAVITANIYGHLRTDLIDLTALAISAAEAAMDRVNISALIWLFSVIIHDAAVSSSAPTLLGTSSRIMHTLENMIVRKFLGDRLWSFPSPRPDKSGWQNLDVGVATCVVDLLDSIRIYGDILSEVARSTCRRLVTYLATFAARLSCWHTIEEKSSPSLEVLDRVVEQHRLRFERGDAFTSDDGRRLLKRLSPSAAEVLGGALECCRLWIVEASWIVLAQPPRHFDSNEATETATLLSSLATTSLACGAFIAPPISRKAPKEPPTFADYVRGLAPHAARVGAFATQLLEALERQVGERHSNLASSSRLGRALRALNAVSTLVTENEVLTAYGTTKASELNARGRLCRTLLINGTVLLTIVDTGPEADSGVILIARDGSSRSSWKVNCLNVLEAMPGGRGHVWDADGSRMASRQHESPRARFSTDPLLDIILRHQRYFDTATPTGLFDESRRASLQEEAALLRRILPLPSSASSTEPVDRVNGVTDSTAASSRILFLPAQQPATDEAPNSHMQRTRLLMASMLGVAHEDNFRTILILDGCDDMLCKIDAVDALPERECHVVWIAFARNRPSSAGTAIEIVGDRTYDGAHGSIRARQYSTQASLPIDFHYFMTGEDPVDAITNSRRKDPILGASCRGLGAAIDPSRHQGFDGGVDLQAAALADAPLLYFSDARDEIIFYDTTRPLKVRSGSSSQYVSSTIVSPSPNLRPFAFRDEEAVRQCIFEYENPINSSHDSVRTESRRPAIPADTGGRVLVLWNECTQQPTPDSTEWGNVFGLGSIDGEAASVTFDFYIIIEPVNDGLYRTRLYGCGGPFSFGSSGPVGVTGSLIGPLQNGMVVSRRLLAPLVRQTALNARRTIGAHKRRMQNLRGRNDPSNAKASTSMPERGLEEEEEEEEKEANWQYGHSDSKRWSCPFDGRSRIIETLRRNARPEHNETFGAFLRMVVAPPTLLH